MLCGRLNAGMSPDQTTGTLTSLLNSQFANGGNGSQGVRITPSGSFAVIANAVPMANTSEGGMHPFPAAQTCSNKPSLGIPAST
jgi:hypothetical protein